MRSERVQKHLANFSPESFPIEQRGDADERNHEVNGEAVKIPVPEAIVSIFPPLLMSSQLKHSLDAQWIWRGFLARGSITLLSALWKSGKTTMLAHLIRSMEEGGDFCGQALAPGRILYVTEESEGLWASRRDALRLEDHISFLVRPFRAKPDWTAWQRLLDHLGGICAVTAFDLIIFDTLSNLWPVRDENDACQVGQALMPLHSICEKAALNLVHHNRKSDGNEATASRGSGALTAFVDTIVEFRRFNANDKKDRRRVLTGYGRFEQTPDEVVIELTDDGYISHGEKKDVAARDLVSVIASILPPEPPGLTHKQIEERWPDEKAGRREKVLEALHHGVDMGIWKITGEGRKGEPYKWWKPI